MRTLAAPVAPPAPAIPRTTPPPRKLFYRIQEVSRLTGLKPYVLRYWETEFKELAPAKDASDQRRYRQADIEVILAIRKLLYEDRFTIEGARKRLREEIRRVRGEANSPAPPPPAPGTDFDEVIPPAVRDTARRAQRVGARPAPAPLLNDGPAARPPVAADDPEDAGLPTAQIITMEPPAPASEPEPADPARLETALRELRAEVAALLASLS